MSEARAPLTSRTSPPNRGCYLSNGHETFVNRTRPVLSTQRTRAGWEEASMVPWKVLGMLVVTTTRPPQGRLRTAAPTWPRRPHLQFSASASCTHWTRARACFAASTPQPLHVRVGVFCRHRLQNREGEPGRAGVDAVGVRLPPSGALVVIVLLPAPLVGAPHRDTVAVACLLDRRIQVKAGREAGLVHHRPLLDRLVRLIKLQRDSRSCGQ